MVSRCVPDVIASWIWRMNTQMRRTESYERKFFSNSYIVIRNKPISVHFSDIHHQPFNPPIDHD